MVGSSVMPHAQGSKEMNFGDAISRTESSVRLAVVVEATRLGSTHLRMLIHIFEYYM